MSMPGWSTIPSSSFLKDDPFFDPSSNPDSSFKAIPLPDDNIGFDPSMEPNDLDQLYTTLDLQDLGISAGYEPQQDPYINGNNNNNNTSQDYANTTKKHGRKISGSGIFGYVGRGSETQLSIPGIPTSNINVEFYKKKPVYQEITKFDNIDYSKAHNPVYPGDIYDQAAYYPSQQHQHQQMQHQFQLQQQQHQHQMQHLHQQQQQQLHQHQQPPPLSHNSQIPNNINVYKEQQLQLQKPSQSLPMSAIQQHEEQQQQQQQQQLPPQIMKGTIIPSQHNNPKQKKEAPEYIFNSDFDGKYRFPRPKTPPIPVVNNFNADYLRFLKQKPDVPLVAVDDKDDTFPFFMDEPAAFASNDSPQPMMAPRQQQQQQQQQPMVMKEFVTPKNKRTKDIPGVLAVTPLRISKPLVGLETPPSLKVPNQLSWTPTIISKKTPKTDKYLRDEISQPRTPIRKHSTITTLLPRGQLDSYFSGPDEDHMFTCVYNGCGRSFTRISNIRAHIQTHLCDRPFICEVCRMTFVRNHDLKRHEKGHQEFQYQCPCGKKFSRKDAMKRHQIRMICEGGIPDELGIHKKSQKLDPISGNANGGVRKRGRPRKTPKDLTDKNLIDALNTELIKKTTTTTSKQPAASTSPENAATCSSSGGDDDRFDEEGITDLEIRMSKDYEIFNQQQQQEQHDHHLNGTVTPSKAINGDGLETYLSLPYFDEYPRNNDFSYE